jgi:hypothetical protein
MDLEESLQNGRRKWKIDRREQIDDAHVGGRAVAVQLAERTAGNKSLPFLNE